MTQGSLEAEGCLFDANHAVRDGGAIWFLSLTELVLRESILHRNRADREGGAIYMRQSGTASVVNCTLFGNEAVERGSAIRCRSGGHLTLSRTIIAESGLVPAIDCSEGLDLEVGCVDMWGNEGGDWGDCTAGREGSNGNFSADPEFCIPLRGDFSLLAGSPCAPETSPPACGLVGALGVGCGTVSVTPTTFGRIKAAYRDVD